MSGPKSLDEAWTAFEAKNPDWQKDKKPPLHVARRVARDNIGRTLEAEARHWKSSSKICAASGCKNKFLLKRTDAEFCSAACRKASSRQRKVVRAADAAARTANRLARYRWWAKEGSAKSRSAEPIQSLERVGDMNHNNADF